MVTNLPLNGLLAIGCNPLRALDDERTVKVFALGSAADRSRVEVQLHRMYLPLIPALCG